MKNSIEIINFKHSTKNWCYKLWGTEKSIKLFQNPFHLFRLVINFRRTIGRTNQQVGIPLHMGLPDSAANEKPILIWRD